jgi:HD-GYP domain-containing protein (c-di-GMP phosphodiesterase class II)
MNNENQNVDNEKSPLSEVYQDLLSIVRLSIDEKIEKEHIDTILGSLINAFEANLYNELLLYFYTNSRDNYIYGHIANNVILSVGFATSLGLSKEDIYDTAYCAFGHDFGMKEYLELFQKTTTLTPEESKNIHKHPEKSAALFQPYFSQRVLEAMLDMHECVNGQGYPKGKMGPDISFLAKIVSLCDVFEALTHARVFRAEFSPYEAIKMIINKKDIIFERKIVKKFVEYMSIYPVGSLVHINTGEVGIVIAGNRQFPTRSVVRVLINAQKEAQSSGRIINLLNETMVYINGPVQPKEEKEIRTAFSIL